MSSVSSVARLAVLAGALLSAPASGARLRKAEVGADVAAMAATVARLGVKYDCNLNAASLVTTLKQIKIQNRAAADTLKTKCDEAHRGFEKDLSAALGASDALEATADAAGAKVYSDAETPALAEYEKVRAEHAQRVDTAMASKEAAQNAEKKALASFDEEKSKRETALAVYASKALSLDEAGALQNQVMDTTRKAAIASAQALHDTNMGEANSTRHASNALCQSAYTARMDIVKNDENIINDEIKPLLKQLGACSSKSSSGAADLSGATSLQWA